MAAPLKTISLLDVTLRDGEQTSGVAFASKEKLDIAKHLLSQLKVDRIEVASAGVSVGEEKAVKSICDWAKSESEELLHKIEILAFVNGTRSVDWALQTGVKVINLLVKGSRKHCEQQLGKSLEQHLVEINNTVNYANKNGLIVNTYLEDWSNGIADDATYVMQLVKNLSKLPIKHYMLPDTLGVLSPDQVHRYISQMVQAFPKLTFDFHPHNDYGLAVANCLQAVKAGITNIHCTVNCLGERAGNVSLAEVALALKDLGQYQININESQLFAASELVQNYSGKMIADNAPIVGRDVFTQTAGIHADGDKKGNLYHTVLSPNRFRRQREYALGKLSGKASLHKNLERLGISLTPNEEKQLLARIVELGDQKKHIDYKDIPMLLSDMRNKNKVERVQLINCTESSSLNSVSTFYLRLKIDGEEVESSGSGNGGFAAFINACQNALQPLNYQLPELIDYKIVISRSGKADALTECFIVWAKDGGELRTRGVHANQVFAGVIATLRLINTDL